MKRVLKFILILVGGVVALPLIAFFIFWLFAHFVQSPLFARDYFSGKLVFAKVLESRKWHWGSHPWAGGAFGCSFAIVELPEDAPTTPPEDWRAQWSETPLALRDGQHDIFKECTYLWRRPLVERLQRAIDNPGSYYSRSSEVLLLFSFPERIAARIRFGD